MPLEFRPGVIAVLMARVIANIDLKIMKKIELELWYSKRDS